MSDSSFTTTKGSVLELMNLKGKKYMIVANRLVWLNDDVPNFTINTEFLKLTDEQAICKATIVIMDKDGKVIKSATATKSETKKDFPDFIEKAETGSSGRALALLGFGTAFALQDLDEGNRLADSPLNPVSIKAAAESAAAEVKAEKKSTFRKPSPSKPAQEDADGWEN
jgi:hypothetical protein